MASAAWTPAGAGFWRFSSRDSILVALAAAHALLLALWPGAPLIAAGVWWNSNTIAHNFIHRPFFRSATANRLFSAALSALLGIPQALWRDRHLAHHSGTRWRLKVSAQLAVETVVVAGVWCALAVLAPRFFVTAYLPGYICGLALCALQGHWEHAAGSPTSHYGRIYNFLTFNDGHHAEHHADPAIHWTGLPHHQELGAAISRWPPLLRWLDRSWLEVLECLVLRSSILQRIVVRKHRQALQTLLPHLDGVRRISIVGGGLFPRTAVILRELLPAAQLTLLDGSSRNLEAARRFLGASVEYSHRLYVAGESLDTDLTVIPLCLTGDRTAIYRSPPSRLLLVHDWIWRRRGRSAAVSPILLKRLNLVRR